MMPSIICLLLLTVVMVGTRADSGGDCPLWHYRQEGRCKCGNNLHGIITCSSSKVYLRIDYAMDVRDNDTVVSSNSHAYHDYKSIPSHLRVYSEIPTNISKKEIRELMCKKSNREGFLCSKCFPNHGPSAYYYKCSECHHSLLVASLIYLTLKLLPVLVFFIVVMTLRINVTNGPVFGYILFCQVHTIGVVQWLHLYEVVEFQLKDFKFLLEISYCLSAIWTLDLNYMGFSLPFCLSPDLSDVDVLLLNFISPLFPLFLVIISCILIELHARNCRLLVLCWRPLIYCFATVRRNLATSDSTIHAFASLLFLSFITLNANVFSIFTTINVYVADASGADTILTHPTTTQCKYCYLAVTLALLLFLAVFPSLVLLLYPIRLFRAQLLSCFSRRLLLGLNTFVETFQGPFKDGSNGTRDFRTVPGLFALLIVCLGAFGWFAHSIAYRNSFLPGFLLLVILSSVLCAYVHPFKSSSSNYSATFHLLWMAALGMMTILWTQDFIMDTKTLAFSFAFILPIPHLVMFVWVCYKIENKLQMRQRCVVRFNCFWGQGQFGQLSSTAQLPNELLCSQEISELS